MMKKIFVVALIFFIATVVMAGFIFVGGANFISSRNVDISILGPTNISAGELLELGVSVSNTNNADLEFANLSIQYPQGARNPENSAEAITYLRESLGIIKAGEESTNNVQVVLLGSTGEAKEIKFSIEYKVKGSNATFYKDKIYKITIGNAPITLSIVSPEAVTSGDEFATEVTITMNATDTLRNAVLKAEYPYGYSVTSATPGVATDNNIWLLGDLSPGDKKTVSIRGRLIGENEEERTFRFYVGVSDTADANPNLKISIASLLNTIAINRSAIGLNIRFNGENVPTYIAPAARIVSTNIVFQNNLPDRLLNPRIEVSLSGAALDKNSVRVGNNGTYDHTSSKAVWTLSNTIGSSELAPGANGQVTLFFASMPASSLSGFNNDIKLNFFASGIPVDAVGQGVISTTDVRTVRISSQINFSSKALRSLGSFANHGPIPPRVGEETTYSIVFGIGNTQGDIEDIKVTARLGPSVTWLGAPDVGSENIVYDSYSNSLTWEIDSLPSGAGFSSEARELAFQVNLTPTLGQVGTTPVLVNNIIFSGRDAATGSIITLNNASLTTRLTEDPAFIQGDDIVVK